MSKERPLQSMAIVIGPCWTNFCSHLVSTERRYVIPSRIYTRCFAPCFWRPHYQPQSWCRLTTLELRFDTVGLLFDKCYTNKPETIDALKENICEAIGEIQLHTIDNDNKCMASRGSQLNENNFPLLTGRIVFSNKKRNLRKYSVVFFKAFSKKKFIWLTLYFTSH